MAFSFADRKAQDKKMAKHAQAAQNWLKKGFSPADVAKAIWNKTGRTAEADGNSVKFYGCYNDEYENWRGKRPQQFYLQRTITAEAITKHEAPTL